MTELSRRRFLSRGSLGVALAGALAAVPGLSAVFRMPAAVTPGAPTGEPLIAHVRDVQSGEIALLVGTDKVIHRDADLAARLYNAARSGGR
jgi:hypothetical protein